MSTDSVASTRQAAVRVVTGHYGSGKTEVSVSLAMRLAGLGHKVALADLDIVNPYFRSREQADLMTAAGIEVISSTLGHTVTLDLPAVSPKVHVPLADPTCEVILDAGGNEVGVKDLAEFAGAGADPGRRLPPGVGPCGLASARGPGALAEVASAAHSPRVCTALS